jgi:hypothetical protein
MGAMTDNKPMTESEELEMYKAGVAKALEAYKKNERQGWIGGLVSAIGSLFIGISVVGFQHLLAPKPKTADLPMQIGILTDSLKDAAKTIDSIEQEIKQRQALVDQLEREADTASKLKTLNADQLNAVAQVLGAELKTDQRQNFWNAQGLAFFYAAVGVALSELYRFILRWRARRRVARTK